MSLATIYDHLLGHGLVQTLDFGGYLESLCVSLRDFQEKGDSKVSLICKSEPMMIDLDLVTSLGIVVAEVISNAYLHAFPAKEGTIRVSLARKEGMGVLTIEDDGIGFIEKVESKRHGVSLIKRLVEQAKGTAKLDSSQGTLWSFSFPFEITRKLTANDDKTPTTIVA